MAGAERVWGTGRRGGQAGDGAARAGPRGLLGGLGLRPREVGAWRALGRRGHHSFIYSLISFETHSENTYCVSGLGC